MQIDWGQIVTHIIGFLLAVGLLKKYAWGHLLGFVEKRRQTIADSFDQIEKGKAEVEVQRSNLEREMEKIEDTRRKRITEAAQEAESLANDIKEDARREAVATREKAKQDVSIELDKANEVLKDRMIHAVLTTTEKLLAERLDKSKHQQLIDDFLSQVKVD
jgi:F-type H+-transporting ATPase subunit b